MDSSSSQWKLDSDHANSVCLKSPRNFRVYPHKPENLESEEAGSSVNISKTDNNNEDTCSIISGGEAAGLTSGNVVDRGSKSRTSLTNLSKRFRNKNKVSISTGFSDTSGGNNNNNNVSSYITNGSFAVQNDSEKSDSVIVKAKCDKNDNFLCENSSSSVNGVGGNSNSASTSVSGFKKFFIVTTIIYISLLSLIPLELSLSPLSCWAQGEILHEESQQASRNRDLIKGIWEELTEDERSSIFGSSHISQSNSVPNFDIIEPKVTHRKSRGIRSLGKENEAISEPNRKLIKIDGLGRHFKLTLNQNQNLLDPHFVFLKRRDNQSEIMPDLHVTKQLECFYQGNAEHFEKKGNGTRNVVVAPVALSLCGGLKGFILTPNGDSDHQHDDQHYVIHPVPERLHKPTTKQGNKSPHEKQHFLFKRQKSKLSSRVQHAKTSHNDNENEYTCGHHNHNNDHENKPPFNSKQNFNKMRKRRSSDFFTKNDPFVTYGTPSNIAPDSYWLQYRSNLFTPPSRTISASTAAFPSSYWRQKSGENFGTGMSNVGLSHRYDDDDGYDDHESSASSSVNSDMNWSKGVLVYESTSSNEEPDTILPFYTKGRKRSSPSQPQVKSSWTSSTSSSDNPHTSYSSSADKYPQQNYTDSSKYFRKGRRDENYFGPDWKSPLDSNIMFSDKNEKAQKQSRYDIDSNSNSIYSREREKPPAQLTIETAVFVDKDLYKHMQSNFPDDTHGEVVRIVLAMINAVQLLYHDPSLGHRVDFVLKRLEVLETDPPGLLRPYDIDRFLTNFCKWQKTENPSSDADPLHWDHALILTGLDLYVVHQSGKISNQVVGLAPVAGMCTRSSSCTVNEGRHFESVFVISHEIGHNLGMRHDGRQADNECDPTSHIMSPTLGSGKITWSPCSRKYLDMFLETSQSKCLLDKAKSEIRLDHDADGRLPGERFDADRQCVLKYGRGSFHATQQPLEDVCRDLHCRREHYTWTSHPALEGTYCGTDMLCRAGKCVRSDGTVTQAPYDDQIDFIGSNHLPGSETAAYTVQKAVDGAWGKWSLFTDCSSACLYSNDGSLGMGSTGIRLAARRCDSPRPENGGRQCSGPDRRYKTCTAHKICSGNVVRTTISQYANDVCNRASTVDNELTGVGYMMSTNDAERACSVWCETLDNGVPRSRGWSFPDGTACKVISPQTLSQSYCVAGKCQDFTCNPYSHYALSDDECSFSGSNEVTPSWYTGTGSHPNSRAGKTGWTDWEAHSECKLPCLAPAKGLELVKRLCSSGESLCSGLALSVRLCKPDKATIMRNGCTRLQTPFEYATKVCSKYAEKITGLSGIGMQLSPTKDDKDRPCRIGCQDASIPYRFYMVNGEDGWFPAGTDCSRGDVDKKAYCVAGKCVDFGKDDTPVYRVNSKLMGRIETLFQRSKRQASYNIMEPLNVPASLDQSSLRDLVHKFSQNTGNFPSIASRRLDMSVDFKRPVVIQDNLIDYPPISRGAYPGTAYVVNTNHHGRTRDNYYQPNSNYLSSQINYHPPKTNGRGRSLSMDFVDVDDMYPAVSESSRMISSHSDGNGAYQNQWGNSPIEGSFYEWRRITSDCSVMCGEGIQEVIVECVSGDTKVADRWCEGHPRPGYSGYVNCHKPKCLLTERSDGQGQSSHIWNWLQSLLPKNSSNNNGAAYDHLRQ